jgi:probable rRNA maturation factor
MVRIDINTSPHYPADRRLIRLAASETLKKIGIKSFVQLSVSVSGDRKVRELNRKFRGSDETTNVLSFPLYGPEVDLESVPRVGKTVSLGDVVISYPVARVEAAKDNILVDHRLVQLTVHGVLHLVGFDHQDHFQTSQMERLEDEICEKVIGV